MYMYFFKFVCLYRKIDAYFYIFFFLLNVVAINSTIVCACVFAHARINVRTSVVVFTIQTNWKRCLRVILCHW